MPHNFSERWVALTLAAVHAAEQEDDQDLGQLLSARERLLDEALSLPKALSQDEIIQCQAVEAKLTAVLTHKRNELGKQILRAKNRERAVSNYQVAR